MLSSIPVQMIDLPALAGETPSGAATAPEAAGELVTFAELLRRPIGAPLESMPRSMPGSTPAIAMPGTGPGLPSGGKNLPVAAAVVDGEDPPALDAFDAPVIVAEALDVPVASSGAPVPLVPAEYRLDRRDAQGPGSSSRSGPALLPVSAAGGLAAGLAAGNVTDGESSGLVPPPTLPSLAPNPGAPAVPGVHPGSADAPEIPAALAADDGVAPPGARSNFVPEAAPAGLPQDGIAPAGVDGGSSTPSPVMASQAVQAMHAAGGTTPSALHAAPASSAPPPLPSTGIGVPVGDPAWADALGDQLLVLTGKQLQRAEIRLHPAELGPVQVQITVEDDATTLAFTAQHAVTREAIEQALPRLRELFGDQGLSLLNTTVSEQGAGQQEQEAGLAGRGAGADLLDPDMPEEGIDGPAGARHRALARDGLIDVFA